MNRAEYMQANSDAFDAHRGDREAQRAATDAVHRAYWSQFVTDSTRQRVRSMVGVEVLRTFADQVAFNWFDGNDGPEPVSWDAVAGTTPSPGNRLLPASWYDRDAWRQLGAGGMSCADRWCIVKEAARQVVEAADKVDSEA